MKTLLQCPVGSTQTIVKISAKGPLKQRLVSFGMMRGSELSVLAYSVTKSTIEIKVGKMQIALRCDEAKQVEVLP